MLVVFLMVLLGAGVLAWALRSGRIPAPWDARLSRWLSFSWWLESPERPRADWVEPEADMADEAWSPRAAAAPRTEDAPVVPVRTRPPVAIPVEPALPVIGLEDVASNLAKDRYRSRDARAPSGHAPLPVLDSSTIRNHLIGRRAPPPVAAPGPAPVIGADEIAANLRGQRRAPAASANSADDSLPLIDPDEVRANLQQIHGHRRLRQPVPPRSVPPAARPTPAVSAPVPRATPPVRRPAPVARPEPVAPAVPVVKPEPVATPFVPVVPEASPVVAPVSRPEPVPFVPVVKPEPVAAPVMQAPVPVAPPVARPEPVAVPAVPVVKPEPVAAPFVSGPAPVAVPVAPAAMPDALQAAPGVVTDADLAVFDMATGMRPDVSADSLDRPAAEDRVPFSGAPSRAAPAATPLVWTRIEEKPLPAPEVQADSVSVPDCAAAPVSPPVTAPVPAPAPAAGEPFSHAFGISALPDLSLLRPSEGQSVAVSEDSLLERGIVIEEKLSEFKVKVSVVDAYAGPVITRFEVEPATGVRGSQVMNLVKDLSRALGLASIRVVETIPGKTCMGLELPNPVRQMIRLSEIFGDPVFTQSGSRLTLALGKDITGQPVVTDLARAPHLLVAGTTGSGKSVGVNAMILSMLYKATPDEVRFIMIDPKMLELSVYNDIPHLLAPVVTDMKLAANALNWCVGEMERRYRLMSALGVRNLAGYNDKVREAEQAGRRLTNPFSLTPETPEPLANLPFIVVVVDEFADLMMVAGKKIEELIARLAQKARAAGIHLILATQRPSVDVITGLIKANIPTRIAFQVSSKIDSRTILDQMGAEALLGQGDMLFLPPGSGYPQRIHGAFVTDDEVHEVVEFLKQFGEPDYVEGLLTGEAEADEEAAGARTAAASEQDPLYDEAVEIVMRTRKPSISSVQRHLRIGYNRAARLIEEMEAAGLVSSMESNGNRTVLVPQREF